MAAYHIFMISGHSKKKIVSGNEAGSSIFGANNTPATNSTSGTTMSSSLPLGLQLNNPGNIRKANFSYKGEIPNTANGTKGQFKRFMDYNHVPNDATYGYRAMATDLYTFVTKEGADTLSKITAKYAPAEDGNDPVSYAKFVSDKTGIPVNQKLTAYDFKAMGADPNFLNIMRWMVRIEQKQMPNEDQMRRGYQLFKADFNV